MVRLLSLRNARAILRRAVLPVAATGDIYAGLWYPIGIAVMTLVIGLIFLKDTKGVGITIGSGVANQAGKA